MLPDTWRGIRPRLICGIWCTPHLTGMYGTRPFFGWDRAQGRSPHAPGVCQKCLRPRRHSPCYGRLRRRAINPTLPKEVKAWGKGPLRPKEISRYRDTLGQIRAADNTAGRSANPTPGEVTDRDCSAVFDARPTLHKAFFGVGPFFGWDRAQGRSPHAPGVCQKCLRPRRHSPC